MSSEKINKLKLFYLIFTGELIFALPFHINRFFRPSLLEEFQYTNYMLGIAFTIYGITALICYFPGGYIADKFNTRILLSISLILTSFGGFLLLFYPSFYILCLIYGYWGITSILFCWSALIKATRLVGSNKQGLSFGSLEAGRGLVAASMSSIAVVLFTSSYFQNILEKSGIFQASPLSIVIIFYSIITFTAGLIVWFFYKNDHNEEKPKKILISLKAIRKFYKPIAYQSLIVLSAYSAFKGVDYYTQYFYEILEYSIEKASYTMSNFSYLRPICAICAGIIADKISATRSTILIFIILFISFLFLIFFSVKNNMSFIILINIVTSMIAVFALRGIYFCYLHETQIPKTITGLSVGIISLVGFFPDVYMGPILGYFLDNFTSANAFNLFFIFLFIISTIGLLSAIKLHFNKKNF